MKVWNVARWVLLVVWALAVSLCRVANWRRPRITPTTSPFSTRTHRSRTNASASPLPSRWNT